MKGLIISLAGIGDTLFATPLIHELRANFPQAQIDALVLWRGSCDVLEGNPHLGTIYQKNLIRASKPEALQFLGQLRKQRYDFSINTHPQSRIHYRLVARLISAPVRISHSYDGASVLDRLLVNRTLPQDYARHSIDNNLALLTFVQARPILPRHEYEIFLSGPELKWAEAFIDDRGLAGHELIGIHVGSGGTKNLALRRWPLDSYVQLIRRLNRERPGSTVLLFGGPEEEKDHEQILSQVDRRLVLHPKTNSLRQAAALLQHCGCFLSVDTALMHVAAAMKVRRQVVIETPTWNKPIEPYGQTFILVPNPAVAGRNLDFYRYDGRGIQGTSQEIIRCMESVSVEAVFEAVTGR
jgi:ADP-heptose:LPS heptosyltransferase